MTSSETDKRREKARALRYKHALVRDLNYDTITANLFAMQSTCDDVYGWTEVDTYALIDALDGDEDDAQAFRLQFADLSADIDHMVSDLNDWSMMDKVAENFDAFMVGCSAGAENGGVMGYDSMEGDYFGLEVGWETEIAVKAAREKLTRLTKNELIDTAQSCMQIAFEYIGIVRRYEDLDAALEILKSHNLGCIQNMKKLNELYNQMDEFGSFEVGVAAAEFDRLLQELPPECFLY